MNSRERTIRTEMLLGGDAVNILNASRVCVCGLGGVGSFAAEAIARCGVGHMVIIDNDTVSPSNINRQLPALCSTVGRLKTDIMSERIKDINPDIELTAENIFISPETDPAIFSGCDYIIDAVDNMAAKLWLVKTANEKGIGIISSMGCGNRLDPTRLKVTDIFSTSGCPLARTMRHELRKMNIPSLEVVFSDEAPLSPAVFEGEKKGGHPAPSSMIFVPASAGLLLAKQTVSHITQKANQKNS